MPRVLNYKRNGLPPGVVYIGRPMPRYAGQQVGEPLPAPPERRHEDHAEVITRYERHLYDSGLINDVHGLCGRDVVCWCADVPTVQSIMKTVASRCVVEVYQRTGVWPFNCRSPVAQGAS